MKYFYSKTDEVLLEKHAKIYYNYNILKDEKKTSKNKLSNDEIKDLSYEVLNYIKELKKSHESFYDGYTINIIEAFCNLNIEDYETAIKIYKKQYMFYEVGEVYFKLLNDFENAFTYYSLSHKYSKAIESLTKSKEKDRLIRLFDYINKKEIYIELGLSEYFNCYKKI